MQSHRNVFYEGTPISGNPTPVIGGDKLVGILAPYIAFDDELGSELLKARTRSLETGVIRMGLITNDLIFARPATLQTHQTQHTDWLNDIKRRESAGELASGTFDAATQEVIEGNFEPNEYGYQQ